MLPQCHIYKNILKYFGEKIKGKGPGMFNFKNIDRIQLEIAKSPVGPGWPIEYSLGMMCFSMPRIFSPLQFMPQIIGHTGVCGSWLFHCPSLDVCLAGNVSQVTASLVPFPLSSQGPEFSKIKV